MFGLGYQELIVILLIVLVLFGASQIPKLSRAIGKSVGELQKGLSSRDDESKQLKRGS